MMTSKTATMYEVMKVNYPEYLEEIGRLRYKVWSAISGFDTSAVENGIWTDKTDAIAHHWIVLHEGELIAAARLSAYDRVEDLPSFDRMPAEAMALIKTPVAFLSRMVVHPDYRRQGISKLIDEQRMACARELKVKTLTVEPVLERIKHLQDYGFITFEVLKNVPEMPGVSMCLMISNDNF